MRKHKYPLVRIRSAIASRLVTNPDDLPAMVNQALEEYLSTKTPPHPNLKQARANSNCGDRP